MLKTLPTCRNAAPETEATYQIGPVAVRLSCALSHVVDAYRALYADFACPASGSDSTSLFTVRVFRRRSRWTGLSHYHIESDVDDKFTVRRFTRVLPHIEGAVNLCIARYMPRHLLLHAAALTRNGIGVMLPGGPGFGKTTLAAALTARGWKYASDEFAMIDDRHGMLVPYPKALSIKAGSFELLRADDVPVESAACFDRADKGAIRLMPARAFRNDAIASTSRIGLVVFPTLEPGCDPIVTPMTQAEAVFEMSRRCFNLLRYRSRAIEILADIARSARCYRVRTGDLEATCDVMNRLAGPAAARRNQAASGQPTMHAA